MSKGSLHALDCHVVMTTAVSLDEYLDKMEVLLGRDFPACSLMPAKNKVPLRPHAGMMAEERWDVWNGEGRRLVCAGADLNLLMYGGLIVIDVDDHDLVSLLTDLFPHMGNTAVQETTRGGHFIFRRSALCDELQVFDKAGAVHWPPRLADAPAKAYNIDIKSVCSTGTGGCLAVWPSPGKTWHRPPWVHAPIEMPDDLLRFLLEHHTDYGLHCEKVTPSAAQGRSARTDRMLKPIGAYAFLDGESECGSQIALTPSPLDSPEPTDAELVRDIFECLDPAVAEGYHAWCTVGMCLHCHGRGTDAYFPLWVEFSRGSAAKFKGVPDCRKTWAGFKFPMTAIDKTTGKHKEPRDFGMLCQMAIDYDVASYDRAQAKHFKRAKPADVGPVTVWDTDRWTKLLGGLIVRACADGILTSVPP